MRKHYEKMAVKLGLVGTAAMAYIESAMAALDTADVQTKLTAAVGSGETVGGYVVGGVAALVVIGLIIGIVKKL